ncbi:MAG: prepilin peptidase [Candidatus Omnitrophica bacterium]|nr:prepilin peptidase [Candidatus Omnitrophota bacterium]
MTYVFLIIFGAIIGSFLNVCIYRLPRAKSIVSPGSHCVKCGHNLKWHENIPILSFIILKGRCSKCKERISSVYPLVELITAALAVIIFIFFGISFKAVIFFVLFCSLVIASFIDFEHHEIPDIISLPGIAIGLILSFMYPALLSKATGLQAFFDSLIGVIIGGGSLYILGFLGEIVFKKDAMGGGDIKLLAMIGAFLGWKLIILTFFIAPFFGAIAGIILKIKEGGEIIPYGPYLSFASLISLLYGDRIIRIIFRF